jgi:hydroxylamine reductase (hybrid-cluster protein)
MNTPLETINSFLIDKGWTKHTFDQNPINHWHQKNFILIIFQRKTLFDFQLNRKFYEKTVKGVSEDQLISTVYELSKLVEDDNISQIFCWRCTDNIFLI